jgi:hypothetical protein
VVLKQNSKKTGIFQEKETGFQDISSVQRDLKTDEQQVRKKKCSHDSSFSFMLSLFLAVSRKEGGSHGHNSRKY